MTMNNETKVETPVQRVVALIASRARAGMNMDLAARDVARRFPALVANVMDVIGTWPSSESELAALQRATR
jgi:pyrroline-5-carboxylate reductase